MQSATTCSRDSGCKQKEQSEIEEYYPFGKVSSIGKGVVYVSNGEAKYILKQISLSYRSNSVH